MSVRTAPLDFLPGTGYRLFIKRLPTTAFTIQTVPIPNVRLGALPEATPFVAIPKAGSQLVYDELRVKFLVDKDLVNYLEIYKWLTDLGTERSFWEYRQIVMEPGTGVTSDVTVYILDAKKNPVFQVHFFTCVPTSLGGLVFDATTPRMDYLQAEMTLAFRSYDIESVPV
jgi:hypothetical protein